MEPVCGVEICEMASINPGDTVFALPSRGERRGGNSLPTECEPSGLTWNFCVQLIGNQQVLPGPRHAELLRRARRHYCSWFHKWDGIGLPSRLLDVARR